jgi:tetratricopeptide (TPR) repeat protein
MMNFKIRALVTGLLLFVTVFCFSQNTIFIPELKKANALFDNSEFKSALKSYLNFTKSRPDSLIHPEVLYRIAYCIFLEERNKFDAKPYLERYIKLSENRSEAYLLLANFYHLEGKYDQALDLYRKFIDFVQQDETENIKIRREVMEKVNGAIESCEFAKIQSAASSPVIVKNAGANVNSQYSEYAPVVSANDSVLYFTRRSPENTGGKLAPDKDYYEDIYSCFISDTGFTKASQLPSTFNTKEHEGALQLSPDNKKLYFYSRHKIMYSELYTGIFLTPKEIEKKNDIHNHSANEPSVYISPDGNTMIFSSDRPGGFGGLDLYKTVRSAGGIWSMPENLGAMVNSKEDDDFPFFDSADSVLYFSSKGRVGMGGYDIFKSSFKNSQWTEAKNMGYPINSPADEISFVITPDQQHAYFASDKIGGLGMFDIYKVIGLSTTTTTPIPPANAK